MKENSQIVGITIAKLAREKGFNEACDFAYCLDTGTGAYYTNYDPGYFKNTALWEKHFAAPKREAINGWLRRKMIFVDIDVIKNSIPEFTYHIATQESGEWKKTEQSKPFENYENALESAILDALSFV